MVLVSIVIPTKNRRALLTETIASIRQQTYPCWEAIVVDDGSSDGTAEMVTALATAEPRIQFRPRTGDIVGACACRNQGVAAATSDYIIFLDSDDLLAPFCLEQRVDAMEQNPELDFAVFPSEVFALQPGDVGRYHNIDTGEDDLERLLKLDIPWQTTSPIWRRAALKRLGHWDESLPSWQDWDFHVRAVSSSFRYRKFSRSDCYWRRPVKGSGTIGTLQNSTRHLTTQEELLNKTIRRLQETQHFGLTQQQLVGGLYLFLAEKWQDATATAGQSLRVLQDCRRQHLISVRDYLFMFAYFQIRSARLIWRIRPLLYRAIGKKFAILRGSTTMGRVRVTAAPALSQTDE